MTTPDRIAERYGPQIRRYLLDISSGCPRDEELVMGIARDLFDEGVEELLASGCARSIDGCAKLRDALLSYPREQWSLGYRICQDVEGRRLIGLVYPKTKRMLHVRLSGWPRLDLMADYMDGFARAALPSIAEGVSMVVRDSFGGPLTPSRLPVYLEQTVPVLDRIRSRGFVGGGTREYIMRGLLERLWRWACHYLRATGSGAAPGTMMTPEDMSGLLDGLHEPPFLNPEEKGKGLVLSGIRGGVRYTFRHRNGEVTRMAATRPGHWPERMTRSDGLLDMLPTVDGFLALSEALTAAEEPLVAAADGVVRDLRVKEMTRQIMDVTEKARKGL